ncbi:hypothetical protein OUZ56_001947 [Daphnia magna]|uniref:Uncharacterized protein n=1 Tax=Daphnia magna TaxID=35525 RepID=A0ABR0A4K9_9CRUS|nr:hypothetical protein OUZ56_001947 [Daphnia magna]
MAGVRVKLTTEAAMANLLFVSRFSRHDNTAASGDDDETLRRQQLPSRVDVGLKSRVHHRHIRHPQKIIALQLKGGQQ